MMSLSQTTTRWFRSSIGMRVVALCLLLLLVIQLASFEATRLSLAKHVQSGLPSQLQAGERVLQSLLNQESQKLTESARLLAADYGFRSAVLSNDALTIASALENHGARIGATETALLGTDFSLMAAAGGNRLEMAALASRLAARAVRDGRATEVTLVDGQPHQVVLVPIKAPLQVGWVLMGLPLNTHLADQMSSLSALHLTVLTQSDAGVPWRVAVSDTPGPASQAFALRAAELVRPDPTGMHIVDLDGHELGVLAKWLTPPVNASSEMAHPASVAAVLSLSIDEATRLPADLQGLLSLITLAGFAVFTIGSLYTARQVTTPLRALSVAADRLGQGDYQTTITGLTRSDEIGHLAHAFEKMRANVADKQNEILKLAYWDTLTGLPNRVQFRNAVDDAIAQAQARDMAGGTAGRASVAVIVLNLDRFKHVNDVLGYRIGDLLLRCVSERLSQQMVRGADLVGRLSGDGFAVLLREGDAALAQSVAERIGLAFDEPLQLEDHTVDMGAGVGMACWPQHAADADTLLSRAEIAMYAAKRKTEGPVMYSASIDVSSVQTLSLLTELRRAVEVGELRLYLQPKLKLDNGRVSGAEALVRWLHPERGLVPPMDFIPFAERTGFIRALTVWVFEEAARHWLRLQSEGIALTLSVNLSTRDLLDPDLPQKFDAMLVLHRVPAEAICLEITESSIMDDPQRALVTLNKLSGLGFKLSIDDFGTGYSSLAYLKRLPVDELKIDKSFVMNMVEDLDDGKIVRSTIDLAHNLGLTVVAEGVENSKVWDMLRELDCDEAQGYHMGKPMPAADFHAWTLAWNGRNAPRAAVANTLTLH